MANPAASVIAGESVINHCWFNLIHVSCTGTSRENIVLPLTQPSVRVTLRHQGLLDPLAHSVGVFISSLGGPQRVAEPITA